MHLYIYNTNTIDNLKMSGTTNKCQCRFIKVSSDQTTNRSDSKRACNIANKIDVRKTTDKKLLLHARIYRQHTLCDRK